jgi:hypothetical protein
MVLLSIWRISQDFSLSERGAILILCEHPLAGRPLPGAANSLVLSELAESRAHSCELVAAN